MLKTISLVAIGGATGSVLRYLLSVLISKQGLINFPWATFITNFLGCLLVGLLTGIFAKHTVDSSLKWLLITGFCGGFTTFSTFSFEIITLFKNNQTATAFVYLFSSLTVCLIAVALGLFLSK